MSREYHVPHRRCHLADVRARHDIGHPTLTLPSPSPDRPFPWNPAPVNLHSFALYPVLPLSCLYPFFCGPVMLLPIVFSPEALSAPLRYDHFVVPLPSTVLPPCQ